MAMRPLQKLQIQDLAAEYSDARALRDIERLRLLHEELACRKSRRARDLAMDTWLMLATWGGRSGAP